MGVVLKQEMNEILPGDDYLISNCSLQYSCAERLKKKKSSWLRVKERSCSNVVETGEGFTKRYYF